MSTDTLSGVTNIKNFLFKDFFRRYSSAIWSASTNGILKVRDVYEISDVLISFVAIAPTDDYIFGT